MDINQLVVPCPATMPFCHHEEHDPVMCLLPPLGELRLTEEGVLCGQSPASSGLRKGAMPAIPLPDLAQQPWLPRVDHPQNRTSTRVCQTPQGCHVLITSSIALSQLATPALGGSCGLGLGMHQGLARPIPKRDEGPNCPATNGECHNTFVSGTLTRQGASPSWRLAECLLLPSHPA